jgi:hypothetical protein
MAQPLIVRVDAIRQVAFGAITNTYTPIGAPLAHATRILKILNTTNADMFISFDGVTNNDYVPAGSFTLYDLTTNGIGQLFVFERLTQVSVKYNSAPGSGSVTVVCVYGQGQ